ncbi:DUF4314 domain-containing protein [Actinoplanes sp. NPDC026623]|uniref:DUF4314 domain-containing protein n=1 Tax=Actinoplanes sp. NPDC026623 TaxID=3155610 RepID=UPI0033EF12F8
MTVYLPGQRIVLIHTSDPHTRLRPGTTGTVRRHDQQANTVAIAWDDGSTLSMLLDDGDRIALATDPAAITASQHGDDRPEPASSQARDAGQPAGPAADGDAVTYLTALPPCDIHRAVRNTVVAARYDGATRQGPWAYMCDGCFMAHGVGLGLGRGQRLLLGPPPGAPDAADGSRPD